MPEQIPRPVRLTGRLSDLAGGLKVRRVLPAALKRAVGPFIFFDHFGPVTLPPETDSDVGPHPHIGLATVSYLLEGRLLHRDSLGSVQTITPGAINWMTAGRGIVHSERAVDEERGKTRQLHGLQLWVALPPELEDTEPAFQHVSASGIPVHTGSDGVQVRILVGEAFGLRSPVRTLSEMLYLDVHLPPGGQWTLPALAAEMAVYSPADTLMLNGEVLEPQVMAVLPAHTPSAHTPARTGTTLQADGQGARFVVIGGAPLKQPVHMWWNFVSTDRLRIGEAAKRWEENRFDPIPGETERIPAPRLSS